MARCTENRGEARPSNCFILPLFHHSHHQHPPPTCISTTPLTISLFTIVRHPHRQHPPFNIPPRFFPTTPFSTNSFHTVFLSPLIPLLLTLITSHPYKIQLHITSHYTTSLPHTFLYYLAPCHLSPSLLLTSHLSPLTQSPFTSPAIILPVLTPLCRVFEQVSYFISSILHYLLLSVP